MEHVVHFLRGPSSESLLCPNFHEGLSDLMPLLNEMELYGIASLFNTAIHINFGCLSPGSRITVRIQKSLGLQSPASEPLPFANPDMFGPFCGCSTARHAQVIAMLTRK